MSADSVEASEKWAYVKRVKGAWRERERNMTWEEKVAAIERMRERDLQLKRAREHVKRPT